MHVFFFIKNPNLKQFFLACVCVWGGVIFFTKNPNLKKKLGEGGGEGGGGGRGRCRWMDRRTGPNQFAPSTSSKLGA